ncbi:MAG TPA: DUF948 domain-containing protein [Gemmatimonadaceae bacterium]|jgi:hypothetical protein
MFDAMTLAGAWLIQHSTALPDTVFTKQIATAPNVFDRITGIASGLLTIAILIFVAAAVPAAWNFRKSYHKANQLVERLSTDLTPIIRHASAVADNINYITTSIRHDVQQINATIASANERLQEAVAVTERRLGDFNALLEVVQQEAESMFVSTASAVRGVRTSASALSETGTGPKFARQDEEDMDQLELASEIDLEEELTDGYDSDATASENDVARPRLRSKRRVDRGPSGVRPRST